MKSVIVVVSFTLGLHLAWSAEPEFKPWDCHVIDDSSLGADGVKLADINGDGLKDITTGWEEGSITRIYLNPGRAKVKEKWPAVTVGKTPSVEDAVFVDLDGDGAIDVVSSCEGGEKAMHVHWAPNKDADLLEEGAWKQEVLPASKEAKQQWMYAMPVQVDGKHGMDLIAGSKNKGAQVGWFEAPGDARNLEAWKWHPISPAGWIMSIWPADMDGDGDMDVVVSDRRGKLRGCHWFENPGVGDAQKQPWKRHAMGAQDKEVMSMCLADLDGDGLQDALVAVKDMKILWLRRLDASGTKWETHVIDADHGAGNTRAVQLAYLTPDNHPDLLVTTWMAEKKHGVFWLEGDGTPLDGGWKPRQISGIEKGSKFDRIELMDVDGDGGLDLLTCEENEGPNSRGMGVIWYRNPMGKAQP